MLTPHGTIYRGTTHAVFRDLLSLEWTVQPYSSSGAHESLRRILLGGRAAILFAVDRVISGPTPGLEVPMSDGIESLLHDLRSPDPMTYTVRAFGNFPQVNVPGAAFVDEQAADVWKDQHTRMERHALTEARRTLLNMPVMVVRLHRS